MKSLIVVAVCLLGSGPALACSLHPGHFTKFKNNLIAEIANHYYADLTQSKIKVKDYQHKFAWKFRDSGWECHDTDIAHIELTLSYTHIFSERACTVDVIADRIVGPEVAGGEVKTKTDIQEIDRPDCL